MNRSFVASVAGGALLWAGCNLNEFTVSTTAPVMKAAAQSFNSESDFELASAAAPAQIKTAEGFLVSAPKNRILLELVAEGYVAYAYGFIEDEIETIADEESPHRRRLIERATGLYDRALGYALRLLATEDRHFDEAFHKDTVSTEAEAKKLDKESAPGLLFAGLAVISAINLNRTDLGRVVDLPKAVALIRRSHELDPKFYNAGAAMTLGILYSSQGKMLGGNPTLSKTFFDEALATTGGRFLMIQVMMARYYAVIMQDRTLFETTLKAVLAAPSDLNPEYRLANELAKRRAARYLARAEDFF